MKILHVLNSPRAEGTVRLVLDWLTEPGHAQEVFTLRPDPRELDEQLRSQAAWYATAEGFPAGVAKFPWLIRRVWQVCRLRQPDCVICWSNGFSPWILLGARLAGVRRLITHAGNPPTVTTQGRLQTHISTAVTWFLRGRMVCCSNYVADRFRRQSRAFGSILRVVYNCAPVGGIARAAADARRTRTAFLPRLVMVATLERHKDHATLLKAMPAVIRAIPGATLWIVGAGGLERDLVEQCRSLRLTNAVVFLGTRKDVASILGTCDLFVFSTTAEEGLGTVLIEALAAGLPIVASDVPACREVLENGRWGELVPAANAQALADALIERLTSASELDAEACRDYLERFSPRTMIENYLAVVA